MNNFYIRVFRFFGYEVVVTATPIVILDEAHRILNLIDNGMRELAEHELKNAIDRYGMVPPLQNCAGQLRFRNFQAERNGWK